MVSAEVVEHLGWPGAAQVARVWRERRIGDKVSTGIAYYVTSLPAAKAGPDRLLALVRAHWSIENRLHHYNQVRPHSALNYLTPAEFVARGAVAADRQATGRTAAVCGPDALRPVTEPSQQGQSEAEIRVAVSS